MLLLIIDLGRCSTNFIIRWHCMWNHIQIYLWHTLWFLLVSLWFLLTAELLMAHHLTAKIQWFAWPSSRGLDWTSIRGWLRSTNPWLQISCPSTPIMHAKLQAAVQLYTAAGLQTGSMQLNTKLSEVFLIERQLSWLISHEPLSFS